MGLSCLMHLNCDKTFFLSVFKNKSSQVSFAYFDHSRIKSTILDEPSYSYESPNQIITRVGI